MKADLNDGAEDFRSVAFGKRVKTYRKARKMTQSAFGEIYGRTGPAVGRWERGYLPTGAVLVAIAEDMEISLDTLVYGGDDVGSGIESRIRKIHPKLRSALVERLHREIDETEKSAARIPAEVLGPHVKDNDPGLKRFASKKNRPPPKDPDSH